MPRFRHSTSAGVDLIGVDLTGIVTDDAGAGVLATSAGHTISGTVVDSNSVALSGFSVAIGTATTTTNVLGQFTVNNVTTPYSLVVGGVEPAANTNPGATHVMRLDGLTRLDPVVTFHTITATPTANRSTTLSGSVSSADAFGASQALNVYLPLTTTAMFILSNATNPQAFSGQVVMWAGGAALAQNLHVIGVAGAAYNFYGKIAFTLNDGQMQAVPGIALTAINNVNASATVTAATGAASLYITDVMILDGRPEIISGLGTPITPYGWTHNEPGIPNGLMGREFRSIGAGGSTYATMRGAPGVALGAVTLRVHSTDVAIAGAPSAVARNADFSVTQGAIGAVKLMSFIDYASHSTWTAVYTGTTTKFPDGAAVGVAAPGAGVGLGRTLCEYQDAAVDDTATAGSFARTFLGGATQALFFWGRGNLSMFAFGS